MPELIRSIAARVREYVGNRRRAPRYRARLPFSVSLVEGKAAAHDNARRAPGLVGVTHDLSASGLALIVPAIRIGDRYLTGAGRLLLVALELPAGIALIRAAPVRYEPLEQEGTEKSYLIGARIQEMSDEDRALLLDYLQSLR